VSDVIISSDGQFALSGSWDGKATTITTTAVDWAAGQNIMLIRCYYHYFYFYRYYYY